jgi:O-antigen/teichoic acid export membrane protein
MLENNKLIYNNAIILYVRLFVTTVLGIFTYRFIIKGLGVNNYGLYNVVGGIVFVLSFFNTVMVTSTHRFIAFELGTGIRERVNKIFNVSFLIHVSLAVLLLILSETIGVYYLKNHLNIESSSREDSLFVLRFSTYTAVFAILIVPFQAILVAFENFKTQVLIETIRSTMAFSIAIVILYYTGNKLRLYCIMTVFLSMITALFYFYYCKYNYHDIIKWNFQRKIGKYKEIISFSGWIMLGAAAGIGQSSGSNILINSFFGTVINASYGIASQVNNLVTMFSESLSKVSVPQIIKSYSSGDRDRTFDITVYISKYTFFLMMFPSLPILLDTDFYLKIWLGSVPAYTKEFAQLMIVNALLLSLNNGLPALIQASGKIKYFQIIGSFISLSSLPASWILFKIGAKPPSIMIVYILTLILSLFFGQVLLKKILKYDIKYFIKNSYMRIFYVFMMVLPVFFFRQYFSDTILISITFSIISIIILIVSIYFAGLNCLEREYVKNILKNKIKYLQFSQLR